MIVTLKMNIQDQEIAIDVNMTMAAGRIYRQQFGRDAIDDMTEIYQKVHPSIYKDLDLSNIDISGKTEEEVSQMIMERAVPVYLVAQKKRVELSFSDTERVSQILWAFAKNADPKLPNYEDWIDDFDFVLPAGDLISALYMTWSESAKPTVEIKK